MPLHRWLFSVHALFRFGFILRRFGFILRRFGFILRRFCFHAFFACLEVLFRNTDQTSVRNHLPDLFPHRDFLRFPVFSYDGHNWFGTAGIHYANETAVFGFEVFPLIDTVSGRGFFRYLNLALALGPFVCAERYFTFTLLDVRLSCVLAFELFLFGNGFG